MRIAPERLAYWYLRLNGFLTIENFLVHRDYRRDRSTEVDVLGVRFPFRAENVRTMEDDARLIASGNRIQLVIVEVKQSQCALNGPWTDPQARNMEKVLAAVGAFPNSSWKEVASCLYRCGRFEDQGYLLSLLCIGRDPSDVLRASLPNVPQITFDQILRFIHGRFRAYLDVKRENNQWADDGRALWNEAVRHREVDAFLSEVKVERGPNLIGVEAPPRRR